MRLTTPNSFWFSVLPWNFKSSLCHCKETENTLTPTVKSVQKTCSPPAIARILKAHKTPPLFQHLVSFYFLWSVLASKFIYYRSTRAHLLKRWTQNRLFHAVLPALQFPSSFLLNYKPIYQTSSSPSKHLTFFYCKERHPTHLRKEDAAYRGEGMCKCYLPHQGCIFGGSAVFLRL